jgi:hypothetical protein
MAQRRFEMLKVPAIVKVDARDDTKPTRHYSVVVPIFEKGDSLKTINDTIAAEFGQDQNVASMLNYAVDLRLRDKGKPKTGKKKTLIERFEDATKGLQNTPENAALISRYHFGTAAEKLAVVEEMEAKGSGPEALIDPALAERITRRYRLTRRKAIGLDPLTKPEQDELAALDADLGKEGEAS